MFGKRIELFRLFGFSVKVDLSWLVIAVLVTWSLAAGYFPNSYPELATQTYWIMGLAGMLGLFVSIVLHELSHSLVARQFGMPMRGITLFIFGGVAEMSDEPPSALAEFAMAIAGPIASVLIAGICFGVAIVGDLAAWPDAVTGVLSWLGLINGILVLFNMVPAFPLDGGRVLRSALWHWKGNIRWATRITSQIGSGFGIFLIVAGVLTFITGNPIGGMWYFLIGLFLRNAAQMSYQQLLVRRALEGESVARFMNPEPVTVTPDTTVQDLVENYIYKLHFKMFPVVENGHLEGCVTTRDVREVPPEEWPTRTVRDILETCGEENTVASDADAMQALSQMNRTQTSRVMVVDNSHLAGVLSLKDMMKFLSLKVELEGDEGAAERVAAGQ
jgi:Zn-dependent protease/CBS domain-containing protein